MTPAESSIETSFVALQRKLASLWQTISRINDLEQTIVVIPSLSLDRSLLEKVGSHALVYEERFLYLLLLLRQPRARVVFVTSEPLEPRAVDYCLSLMPGIIPEQARRRLFLLASGDDSLQPLTQKLLDDELLLRNIKDLVIDADRAHIVPFITTESERDLALALGIPIYGCDPRYSHFGTKSGSRTIFERAGVPHPLGAENLSTVSDLVSAICELNREKRQSDSWIVKLEESASGMGNARLDLAGIAPPFDPAEVAARVGAIRPESGSTSEEFLREDDSAGGIVEEAIEGQNLRSPSVQMRITPLGDLEVLSTHDQLLGGESGQIYLGCVFPAESSYAPQVTKTAEAIGRILAAEGVIGRFAIDFVTVETAGGWDHYAIEINLRKGGTTHPYLTLQFLTDGTYDPATATFSTPAGVERFLVASDHVTLEATTLDKLFDLAVVNRLHFDNARQTGVVFHMLGGVERFGKVGLTSVGASRPGARDLLDETLDLIGGTLT